MTRPPFEVADIVRRHGDRVLETHRAWVTGAHRRVFRAIAQCRTAALGGHRDRCEQCAQPALSYNSCRDRHCPKCLTAARNAWVAAREQELLPVGYVHIVFTIPEPLARLALVNKRVVYDLLFQAAADTLLQVAKNPKRLGGAIGGLMVLHTWGQRLQHHPHVHCVVPMGGLAPDGTQWVHARPRFFLPIPVLRQVFRGKLIAGLREAFRQGRLVFLGQPRTARDRRGLPRVPAIALSAGVGGLRQAVILGVTPSIMLQVGSDILLDARDEMPEVFLSLVEEMSHVLVDALERGEVDMALAYDVAERPGLVRKPVLQEELLLVSAKGSAPKGKSIALAKALERDLVQAGERDMIRRLIHDAADTLSLPVKIAFEAQSIAAMKDIAARGLASSIIPFGTAADELERGTLVGQRIEPAIKRTLYLVRLSRHAPFKHEAALSKFLGRTLERLLKSLGPFAHKLDEFESASDLTR